MEYIKSPINYIGNKYKLLNQIIPLFPQKISCFVDVFGGSGTVLINTKADHYIYNDINQYVVEVFEGLSSGDADDIIQRVEAVIASYGLDKTNRSGFERLRQEYNGGKRDWVTLYALMCYSFNYQLRFNSNHEYNSSFGMNRSSFTNMQKQRIYAIKEAIGTDIVYCSKHFLDIDYSDFDGCDLLYFDPPYYASVGSYNDGRRGFEGWSESHERSLLELLDHLDSQGTRWALSNNLRYDNPYLEAWKDKYCVHHLDKNYKYCNYQKVDKGADAEVLITNY